MSEPAAAYDPVQDAIDFLSPLTPAKRHAVVRAIGFDEESLAVMAWLATEPDCDLATAAMVFWRLRTLPDMEDDRQRTPRYGAVRAKILNDIVARVENGSYTSSDLAWDGCEAMERTQLIDAPQVDGLEGYAGEAPSALFGPFGGSALETLNLVFLDFDYADDDIFDAMWRYGGYDQVDLADWLVGKPADVWMQTFEDLLNAHPHDFYDWMARQPECPSCVAGRIFWGCSDPFYSIHDRAETILSGETTREDAFGTVTYILERWRKGGYADSAPNYQFWSGGEGYLEMLKQFPGTADPLDIPHSLLFSQGTEPAPTLPLLSSDFVYWCAVVSFGGGVERPREKALQQWRSDAVVDTTPSGNENWKASDAPPGGVHSAFFYGGPFTGEKAQIDRAWKVFNGVSAVLAIAMIAALRLGFSGFGAGLLLALIGFVAYAQSCFKLGGWRRLLLWWIGVTAISFFGAFFFRWLDGLG
ncbi:MAG: hypothetical protein AAFX08_12355 [Pseudomonadota bacterium]